MANTVGMMRHGHLLAEGPPMELMQRYSKSTLEDVFLQLCHHAHLNPLSNADPSKPRADSASSSHPVAALEIEVRDAAADSAGPVRVPLSPSSGSLSESSQAAAPSAPVLASARGRADKDDLTTALLAAQSSSQSAAVGVDEMCVLPPEMPVVAAVHAAPSVRSSTAPSVARKHFRNISALTWKNVTRIRRNIPFLLFQFALPAIQIILFCLAIGREPDGLSVAVVNADSGPLGRRYLGYIDASVVSQVSYATWGRGVGCVQSGSCWAAMLIGANFTVDLLARFHGTVPPSQSIMNGSTVFIAMDNTNQQISATIMQKATQAFDTFLYEALNVSGNAVTQLPPVYGASNPTFTNFMAPGMIISIGFALSIGLTALAFVTERKEGMLDRTWAAGVHPMDVLIAHVLTQFVILLVQITLMLFFALFVFQVTNNGSLVLVALLALLLGFYGMTYGLVISSISSDETNAIQLALGSFYPVLLLSGIIWPLQGEPTWLQYISYILPTTWAAGSMRAMMGRGWGMLHQDVWMGFVVTLGWEALMLFASAWGLRAVD